MKYKYAYNIWEEIRKEKDAAEAKARTLEPQSLFCLEMYGESYYCINTSGLDADGLIEAYAKCDLPFVEMKKYGKQISPIDHAVIEQGDKLLFSVGFNADRDEITISDGEYGHLYEVKELQKTIEGKRTQASGADSRKSVLENLHHKQNEIKHSQKNAEQRSIEKTDRRMEL